MDEIGRRPRPVKRVLIAFGGLVGVLNSAAHLWHLHSPLACLITQSPGEIDPVALSVYKTGSYICVCVTLNMDVGCFYKSYKSNREAKSHLWVSTSEIL